MVLFILQCPSKASKLKTLHETSTEGPWKSRQSNSNYHMLYSNALWRLSDFWLKMQVNHDVLNDLNLFQPTAWSNADY